MMWWQHLGRILLIILSGHCVVYFFPLSCGWNLMQLFLSKHPFFCLHHHFFFACAKRRNLRSLSNYLQRKVWKATKTWKYFVWIGDKKCNRIHPLALRRLGLLFTMPINLELHTHFFSKEISSKNTKCFNNKKVAEDFQLFDTRHQSTMHHRQLYLKECE